MIHSFTVYLSLNSIWISITPANICWFSRRLEEVNSSQVTFISDIRIYNYKIYKFQKHVFKTSSKHLQRNKFSSSKTSWRRLENDLEEEKLLRRGLVEDVLKTSCLEDVMFWRRLEDYLFYLFTLYLTLTL